MSFLINALGQRVSKTSSAGTTLFAYDEQGHLIEVACLKNLIANCKGCKDAARARLPGAEYGVAKNCN